ncbi:hypothetical protein ACWDO0_28325 [Nocardia rhamnosiphila]
MTDPTPHTTAGDGEPGNHTSFTLIASISFVVLLLVIGVIVLATGGQDDDSETAGPPATSTVAPTTAPSTATGFGTPAVDMFGRRVDIPNNPAGQPLDQSAPQRKPGDPDWLTAAPAGTRDKGGWQRVAGAAVPFSTSDGPTRIRDGVPTGYAHTPQGAALAAAYVLWETSARPGDRVLRERMVVMSDSELAEFDRLKAQGRLPENQPESVTRYMVAPDAFKVVSWADDLCVLELATRAQPDGNGVSRWVSNQLPMVWDGTGWRLRLPADQRLRQETVHTLAGWTPW